MKHIALKISKGMETLIDSEDYERLKADNLLRWNAQKAGKRFYASRNTNRNGKVYLHRYVTNCPDGFCVDHINGDSLDNRKKNLRICSFRENARNVARKEGFKGVAKERSGRFHSQITINGIHVNLGTFCKASEAARMYDFAAAILFGEFACFNFPFSKKFIPLRNQISPQSKEPPTP